MGNWSQKPAGLAAQRLKLSILGLINGINIIEIMEKENGNYHRVWGLGLCWGYIGVILG